MLQGSGLSKDGSPFTFIADVERLRMELNQMPEDDEEVLSFNPFANKFDLKGLDVAISGLKTEPELDGDL